MTEPEREHERSGALLPVVVAAIIIVGGLVLLFAYDARNNRFTNAPESSYEARTVLSPDGDLVGQRISPDGNSLASVSEADGQRVLRVGTVGVDATVPVTEGPDIAGPLVWSSDGQSIVFTRASGDGTAVIEVPFRGGTEAVISTVEGEVLDLDRSEGALWFVLKLQEGSTSVEVSRGGAETETVFTANDGEIRRIAVAPDESRIAYARGTADAADLYVRDLATGEERRLTEDARPIHGIAWAGESLIYSVGPEASAKLWMISPEGLKIAELRTPGEAVEPSVATDGSRVLYRRPGTGTLELLEM